MTVRQIEPIDRAELRATIQKWIDAHTDVDDTDGVGLLEDVLWEINAQPTLTPPNEWVRVEERLPDSQADVLVVAFWHENWQTMIGWYSDTVKKWRVITPHGELEPGGVTHWMPLPEPPDSRQPEGEEDT